MEASPLNSQARLLVADKSTVVANDALFRVVPRRGDSVIVEKGFSFIIYITIVVRYTFCDACKPPLLGRGRGERPLFIQSLCPNPRRGCLRHQSA